MSDFLNTLPKAVAETLLVMVNNEMAQGRKYDPFTGDNLWEAMAESKQEQYDQLAGLLRANDPVAITAALHLIAREYWFDYACRVMVADAEEAVANAEDYNPCAMERWEIPAIVQYQAH
jgi:hypothetical protein